MDPTERPQGGFTLVEILIALALAALLLAGVYGTFFSLAGATARARQEMEKTRSIRGTLDLIRRELASARFVRESDRHPFILLDRDRFGMPASVITIAPTTPPVPGVEDQAIVTWRTIEREGRVILIRESIPSHRTGDPLPAPVLDDVKGFLVECYDGSRWVRTWDARVNGRLPLMARVTITLSDEGVDRTYLVSTPLRRGNGT